MFDCVCGQVHLQAGCVCVATVTAVALVGLVLVMLPAVRLRVEKSGGEREREREKERERRSLRIEYGIRMMSSKHLREVCFGEDEPSGVLFRAQEEILVR